MSVRRLWILCVTVGALVGCSPAGLLQPPVPTTGPVGGLSDAYPGAEGTAPEGYPAMVDSPPGVTPQKVAAVEPPATAPETAPGTASISGVMAPRGGTAVVSGMTFYLTLGQGENQEYPPDYISDPDPARGDVSGQTDAQGRFELANIPPGKYFFFVWGQFGWREIEAGADDQSPIYLELEADERLPLGVVNLVWP